MWETRNTVKKDNSKMFIGGSTFVFFEKTKKKKQQLPTKYHKTIVTIKKYYVVTQVRKPLGVNLSHSNVRQTFHLSTYIHTHREKTREEKKIGINIELFNTTLNYNI